jgi:uncharacterized protein YndB with AHSA1/START domain
MADIYHHFTINSPAKKVFEAISSSEGLDQWLTKSSSVVLEMGGVYTLNFGPPYIWKAVVTKYKTDSLFELEMTDADTDWLGTKVGFTLFRQEGFTKIHFYYTGWLESNEHFNFLLLLGDVSQNIKTISRIWRKG